MEEGDENDLLYEESEADGLEPGIDDLPEFANPEARKIHVENLTNEKAAEALTEQIYGMKDRVKVMKDHFSNVQQEVEHTNALENAKKAEIHTEAHLRQLTSRALGRSQLESKKVQSEIDFVQEQLNSIQGQIYKSNETLDEFKMQMNWNQEELEQWAVACKQKEEDFNAIEKYKRADEFRIKELTLQMQVLTKESLALKARLDNEVSDTLAKQTELDRVAADFKAAHKERQECVERWQDTIAEMRKRDKSILELGQRFAAARETRQRKEELYKEQDKKLQLQIRENKEVEQKSTVLSKEVLQKREEMMIRENRLQEFKGELDAIKNELTAAAEDLITKRIGNTAHAAALEEKRVQLERERQRFKLTREKVENAKLDTKSAELTAKEAEDELIHREAEYDKYLAGLKVLKEKSIKDANKIINMKTTDVKIRGEIQGAKSICRNLDGQLLQLDKEAARQQELLYNAEFQIQQIERKIARGMGERSDEEKISLKKNIEELEVALAAVKEKRKMLHGQSRKLANEIVTYNQRKVAYEEKFLKLKESLNEIQLENRMVEEDIKTETKNIEEIAVLNDLARLEVRRLRDLLSAKSDAVFSLENRKQQLLLSMEERKHEISVHRDVLKAELKALNEDKHSVTMELREREANVERLQSRFQAVARSEADGEHSQAYYIIKAAQKREELQRKGDTLDQEVRKCEREIRALQTTLDHLNTRNTAFRESFQKVDLKGSDIEILKQLEQRTKLNKEALFRKKKELQRLTTDMEEDSRRLDQVKAQNEKMVKQKEHLLSAKNQVADELQTQQQEQDVLQEKMQKVLTKHKKNVLERGVEPTSIINGTLEEKAVRAEVYKDVIQNVLYTLGQLATEFPEVKEQLNSRLHEADLRMPTRPPSKATFRVTAK